MQLQLDLFQAERLINKSQAESFEAWASGRVNAYLSQWRTQAGLNAAGKQRPPVITAISSSLVWKVHRQMAAPQLGPFERKRRADAKARLAQFMVGLLDRELWLTSRQRQILQRHIQLVMPDHWVEPAAHVALHADWSFITMAAAIGQLHGTWCESLQESQWKAFLLMQSSVSASTSSSLLIPIIDGDDWETIPSVYDPRYQAK